MDDLISRQAAIDALTAAEPVRHMPNIKEVEKIIIDHLYIGDKKVTDLIASGRLRLVGFCSECNNFYPPLKAVVDGEVKEVSKPRCSIMFGFVDENGWCYKFERRDDE